MSPSGLLLLLISTMFCRAAAQLEEGTCTVTTEDLEKNNIQLLPSDDPENIFGKSHKHGAQIRVTCKSGFRRGNLAGLVIECSDGKFRYPRCFSGDTCRVNQESLDKNNIELEEVHNNEIFHGEGEEVHFKCKSGFWPRTKLTATCTNSRLNYPRCTDMCRVNQESLHKNNIELEEAFYAEGEEVHFRCKRGFSTDTKPTATCTNSRLNYPRCTNSQDSCRVNQESLTKNNIELDKEHDHQEYFGEGEEIKFKCKDGFVHPSKPTATCTNSRLNYPRCTDSQDSCRVNQQSLTKNNIELDQVHDNREFFGEGEEIQFKCKDGFDHPGKPTARCTDSRLNYPRCTDSRDSCRVNKESLIKNNIELDKMHDKQEFFGEGEEIQFNCKDGFFHRSKPTARCTNSRLIYPRCTAQSSE